MEVKAGQPAEAKRLVLRAGSCGRCGGQGCLSSAGASVAGEQGIVGSFSPGGTCADLRSADASGAAREQGVANVSGGSIWPPTKFQGLKEVVWFGE